MSNLPNALSVLRLAVAAPCVWALGQGRTSLALALLLLAAALDLADGAVARRWRWETPLGGALDAWADAAVLLPAAVVMAQHNLLPAYVPVVGALAFARFVLCGRGPATRDPCGKYLGTTLYLLLPVVLWWPAAGGVLSPVFALQAAASLLTHVVSAGLPAPSPVGKIP